MMTKLLRAGQQIDDFGRCRQLGPHPPHFGERPFAVARPHVYGLGTILDDSNRESRPSRIQGALPDAIVGGEAAQEDFVDA